MPWDALREPSLRVLSSSAHYHGIKARRRVLRLDRAEGHAYNRHKWGEILHSDWEIVHDYRADLGEGPSWHESSQSLIWVDLLKGLVLSTDPTDGLTTILQRPHPVGAAVPRANGGLALAVSDGFELFQSVSDSSPIRVPINETNADNRLNDAKCDPQGRLWAGSMDSKLHTGQGALYRLNSTLEVTRMFGPVTISNGIGWSPTGESMYYIDSPTHEIKVFDFSAADGTISNQRVLTAFDPDRGQPDGMCVDVEGGLWIAFFGGGTVWRLSATGEQSDVLELPVSNPTSCCFGGPDYEDLYVTTAARHTDRESEPLAGSLFRFRPGVRGLATNEFAG